MDAHKHRNVSGKANFVEDAHNFFIGELHKRMDAETRHIAMQRVQTLFRLASQTIHEDPALAQRYVGLARGIAMAAKIRLPGEYRRQVCRHCKRFILPGMNCRVRIQQRREPHVVITCLNCGGQMRIPLGKKKEERAKK